MPRLQYDETSASGSSQAKPDLPVYDRQQLAATRNGGRLFTAFLASFFLIWSIRATWAYSIDETFHSTLWRSVYSSVVKAVLWIVPAVVFARDIRNSKPAEYLGLKHVPSIRQQLLCGAATIAYLGTIAAFEIVAGRKSVSLSTLAEMPLAVLLLQHIMSPFVEEVLFRGLILKELLTLVRPFGAVIANSLLFAAIHLPFWLTHDRLDRQLAFRTIGVFVFSLLAAALYVKTKSVWPSIIAHIANNVMSAVLISAAP